MTMSSLLHGGRPAQGLQVPDRLLPAALPPGRLMFAQEHVQEAGQLVSVQVRCPSRRHVCTHHPGDALGTTVQAANVSLTGPYPRVEARHPSSNVSNRFRSELGASLAVAPVFLQKDAPPPRRSRSPGHRRNGECALPENPCLAQISESV